MKQAQIIYAVFDRGLFSAAYPRRIQAEAYACGFSGADGREIVRGVFTPIESEKLPPQPISPE